ncbi:MAG: histidinol dehydrogenase [Solirubrobacteraceae bacterium]|nr:histidinol dehydrogenase [Solirubrobacteraceae bacterium]
MAPETELLSGDPVALAAELRALVPDPGSVREAVAEIIAGVRAGGDAALTAYTRRFDTGGAEPLALVVGVSELDGALEDLAPDVRRGLERAIENVGRVAAAGLADDRVVALDGGALDGAGLDGGAHARWEVALRGVPVERAAVYVPGGRAPYPSTVIMGVVTARVAEVATIAVCAPPGRDGDIHPVILAACRLAGASVVYRMGGAQAIAALAYGTESVAPVDVIVGPGNLYVQEAKLQVLGQVGIDGFAGPSDLVVIADATADPKLVALDLLAQGEHGPGTLVVGVSDDADLLTAVAGEMASSPDTGAIRRLVAVDSLDHALALAEAFAPEHLELLGPDAEALAPRVSRTGCLFVGAAGGSAFGDYIAGSNHVLPTGGAARFASALAPAHFRRRFTEVRIGDAAEALAREAAPVARAEGFELHARSMEARVRQNGSS